MKFLLALVSLLFVNLNLCQNSKQIEKNSDENFIYDFVNEDAAFPGGYNEMILFIQKNIVYPDEAIKKKISGRVFLVFTVLKDGSIEDIQIDRGVSESIDAESLRIVKSMPKWTPGKIDGESVNSRFRIPIYFSLD